MARLLEELLAASKADGWAAGPGTLAQVQADAAMLRWTALPIRRGGPIVATLQPINRTEAKPNSLSARYGTDAQPLHTDGAHLPKPPDIVVLTCETTSTTPTLLWRKNNGSPFPPGRADCVEHGVFLVSSGSDSFFATAYAEGRLRYDPGCMLPCDARARQTVEYFEDAERSAIEYQWSEPGQVLFIDNRRVLHARASAANEPQRELQRVSFLLNSEAS